MTTLDTTPLTNLPEPLRERLYQTVDLSTYFFDRLEEEGELEDLPSEVRAKVEQVRADLGRMLEALKEPSE